MEQELLDLLDEVEHVGNLLRKAFVDKDELVELLLTSAIAQEHLLIVGPPGTGKSELIKRFALLCSAEGGPGAGAKRAGYFEYLLTKFTEPNEIFGPVNVAVYKEGGTARRNTAGMLPRAEITFLDEVFKANSAILNSLLTILNERVFYNGADPERVPLLCAIGATNSVPDDPDLAALYDRFLLRTWTDNVEESHFAELFLRGWELERTRIEAGYGMSLANVTTTEVLKRLHRALVRVDLAPVAQPYREVVRRIRAEGVPLSDRRVVKLLRLIATSALRHRRLSATPGDFWVLHHVWSDPSQMANIQAIIDPYVREHGGQTWSSERPLADLEVDVSKLEGRRAALKGDTDCADLLEQVESVRRQLMRHSSADVQAPAELRQRRQAVERRTEGVIDALLRHLEQNP